MRILVVDDDPDILGELCAFLGRRGHDVVGANGARQAIAALGRDPFAIVLTDMRMPDGSGLDVLRAANDVEPSPLKLVMTGQAGEHDLNEARRLGARDIFFKPLTLKAILAAISTPQTSIAA
jgi:two-component system response regulator PilR (NtrC family)